ncbi:hypothetical protein IE53DRAFT_365861 [Violaceomyces palustris]|uniref:Uncharacterized protein n=1 Tax=Violaceomyces palustris TaxID=1673888 RepID=A0ACD0P7F6_9BASI|nr:hypothetical protein IE53DRAFT_365861 [Violaceomyces palustris]
MSGPLATVGTQAPQDLDLYTFLFEYFPPGRPDPRGLNLPLLVEAETQLAWTLESFRERVDALSLALKTQLGLNDTSRVVITTGSDVDTVTAVLASVRLGASFSVVENEMLASLIATIPNVLFIPGSRSNLDQILPVTDHAGMARNTIVSVPSRITRPERTEHLPDSTGLLNLSELIEDGRRMLGAGAAKIEANWRRTGSSEVGMDRVAAYFPSHSGQLAFSHRSIISSVLQFADFHRLPHVAASRDHNPYLAGQDLPTFRPGIDASLSSLSLAHPTSFTISVIFPIYAAIQNVICSSWKPELVLNAVAHYNVSHIWVLPSHALQIAKESPSISYAVPSLRFVGVNPPLLGPNALKCLHNRLPNAAIAQGYSPAESCGFLSLNLIRGDEAEALPKAHDLGRLLHGVEVLIKDGAQNPLPAERNGMVWASSPSISSSVPVPASTGDEGLLNASGSFMMTGSAKDRLGNGGAVIAVPAFEDHLVANPLVRDCCLTMVGGVPTCFVSLSVVGRERAAKGGEKEGKKMKAELTKWIADHTSPFKQLKGKLDFTDSIPRSSTGHVLRESLVAKVATKPKISPSRGPTVAASTAASLAAQPPPPPPPPLPIESATKETQKNAVEVAKKPGRDSRRRATHSQIERRRREKINDRLVALRTIVPACAKELEDRRRARQEEEEEAARIAAGGAPRRSIIVDGPPGTRPKRKRNRRKVEKAKVGADGEKEEELGLHKLEVLTHTINYIYELKARIEELETGIKPAVIPTVNSKFPSDDRHEAADEDEAEEEGSDDGLEMAEWVPKSVAITNKLKAERLEQAQDVSSANSDDKIPRVKHEYRDKTDLDHDELDEEDDEPELERYGKRRASVGTSLHSHLQSHHPNFKLAPFNRLSQYSFSTSSSSSEISPTMSLGHNSPIMASPSGSSTLTSPMMSLSAESPILFSGSSAKGGRNGNPQSAYSPRNLAEGRRKSSLISPLKSPSWQPLPMAALPLSSSTSSSNGGDRTSSDGTSQTPTPVQRRVTAGTFLRQASTMSPTSTDQVKDGRACGGFDGGASAGSRETQATPTASTAWTNKACLPAGGSADVSSSALEQDQRSPNGDRKSLYESRESSAAAAALLLSFSTSPEVLRPVSAIRNTPKGLDEGKDRIESDEEIPSISLPFSKSIPVTSAAPPGSGLGPTNGSAPRMFATPQMRPLSRPSWNHSSLSSSSSSSSSSAVSTLPPTLHFGKDGSKTASFPFGTTSHGGETSVGVEMQVDDESTLVMTTPGSAPGGSRATRSGSLFNLSQSYRKQSKGSSVSGNGLAACRVSNRPDIHNLLSSSDPPNLTTGQRKSEPPPPNDDDLEMLQAEEEASPSKPFPSPPPLNL